MNNTKKHLLVTVTVMLLLFLTAVSVIAGESEECEHRHTILLDSYDPTCYSEGYYTWKCEKCDDILVIDMPKDEHCFNVEEVYKEATCTTNTVMKYFCYYGCGEYELKEIEYTKYNHLYGETEVLINSTCVKTGKELFRCGFCDYTQERTLSLQPHKYKTKLLVVPTKSMDGMKNYTCTYCGDAYNKTVTINDITAADVFKDIKENAWYYDAVTYCFKEGYVSGVSEDKFAPSQNLTRAQVVMLLAKLDGVDLGQYQNKNSGFSDVKPGQWYYSAVTWASVNGYASGTGAGKFSPNADVTREQFARFLYIYAEKKGCNVLKRAKLDSFTDAAKVSDWALDAVKWAVANKIINGTSVDTLAPRSTATRAQASQMMMQFTEVLNFRTAYEVLVDYTKKNGSEFPKGNYTCVMDSSRVDVELRYDADKDKLEFYFWSSSCTLHIVKEGERGDYTYTYYNDKDGKTVYTTGALLSDGSLDITYRYLHEEYTEAQGYQMTLTGVEPFIKQAEEILKAEGKTRADLFIKE